MRRDRQQRFSRSALWGTAGAAALMLALTGYAALSGGGHHTPVAQPSSTPTGQVSASGSPAPLPTYSEAATWTEPERWLALPRGSHTLPTGDQTGFPHTQDGAIALMVAASRTDVEGSQSTVDAQLSIYRTYMSAADRSAANEAKVQQQAQQTEAQERASLGLPASGDLPSGAFIRTNVVGFKIIKASAGEVTAYVLTEVSRKAGETVAEKDAYTVSVLGAVWESGDWKLSTAASQRAAQQVAGRSGPAIAAPGDAAFNTAGWTAIRQAS